MSYVSMSVTKRCEFCNTISDITTFRTFDKIVEKVQKHECKKLVHVSGTNCIYCNKHVNLEHYERYNPEFGFIRDMELKPVNHICLSDDEKAQIDMENFINTHEETDKEYFERLNI